MIKPRPSLLPSNLCLFQDFLPNIWEPEFEAFLVDSASTGGGELERVGEKSWSESEADFRVLQAPEENANEWRG